MGNFPEQDVVENEPQRGALESGLVLSYGSCHFWRDNREAKKFF